MKYKLSIRQIFSFVLLSAVLSALTVTGISFFGGSLYVANAFPESAPSGVTDPSVATDEQNNVDVYRTVSPGVVFITSSSAGAACGTTASAEARAAASSSTGRDTS